MPQTCLRGLRRAAARRTSAPLADAADPVDADRDRHRRVRRVRRPERRARHARARQLHRGVPVGSGRRTWRACCTSCCPTRGSTRSGRSSSRRPSPTSGIPLLFQAAYKLGAVKQRCIVKLVGGADVTGVQGRGPARRRAAQPGGRQEPAVAERRAHQGRAPGRVASPRNVPAVASADGILRITSGNQLVAEL